MGRIQGAVMWLMARNNLTVREMPDEFTTLIGALAFRLKGDDQRACMDLLKIYTSLEDQTDLIMSDAQKREEKETGRQEAQFACGKYPSDWMNKILSDTDFVAESEADALAAKKSGQKKLGIILGIIATVILGIIIYNLPYFEELRRFHDVENAYESESEYSVRWAVDRYTYKFPDGKHMDDVLYTMVLSEKKADDVIATLDAVDKYIEECEYGKHLQECKEIYNEIWESEIDKYKSAISGRPISGGEQFVVDMLNYMYNKDIRTVSVASTAILNLKEFSEYSTYIRNLLEYSYSEERFTLPRDMHSIKDKINEEEAKKWTKMLVQSLQHGFNCVLTPGFIKFESEEDSTNPSFPSVHVTYKINTQETNYSGTMFPDIWTYTRSQGRVVIGGGLYLGISLNFSADFTIPEGATYRVVADGDAGSAEFKDIDPSQLYNRMCDRCVNAFTDKISSEFSIYK